MQAIEITNRVITRVRYSCELKLFRRAGVTGHLEYCRNSVILVTLFKLMFSESCKD